MTTPLEQELIDRIAGGGPITVTDYMSACLTHQNHGYYRSRTALGRDGDFITAPEISQMFGELIGLWCAEMWHQMGRPQPVALIELGPGRGTLMADALRAADKAVPELAAARRLYLVEINETLRRLQQRQLGAHDPVWLDDFDELPAMPMLLIANEFFDALPVRQITLTPGGWHERCVGLAANSSGTARLDFTAGPPAEPMPALPGDAPANAVLELNPAGERWAGRIGRRLNDHGGAAVIIDYGHIATDFGDSLQAIHNHRFCSIFEKPGEADLTAHVDFQRLAAAAAAAGARIHGPITQRLFLSGLGIDLRLKQLLHAANETQRRDLVSGYRRLTDGDKMGSLFKVLALTATDGPMPPAFEHATGETSC